MASIEFVQKRIEGKEKEIANLEKKMERILKAQASNWENNPYYYHEDDIRRTSRDLEEEKKQAIEDKAFENERDITAAEYARMEAIDEKIEELEEEADSVQNAIDYLTDYTD